MPSVATQVATIAAHIERQHSSAMGAVKPQQLSLAEIPLADELTQDQFFAASCTEVSRSRRKALRIVTDDFTVGDAVDVAALHQHIAIAGEGEPGYRLR